MNNEQLYKRQNGNYKEVYPNILLSSILDKKSGKALKDIISAYNHLYVPFVNNIYETLTAIPVFIRRKGLWVTWETKDGINTYQFNLSTAEAADDFIWGNIESWEQVPDLDYYNNHGVVPDGSITLNKLSDEIRQWLVNAGKIINYPDEEDIAEQYGLLKFADRPKVSGVNSMGYKILRRNKSFVEQVTEENTIYEIKYDFTLNENFTIPNNCILKFEGGSIISTHTLTGSNTSIQAGLVKIFNTDITLAGTWNVSGAYLEWFGIQSISTDRPVGVFIKVGFMFMDSNAKRPIFVKEINGETISWIDSNGYTPFLNKGTTAQRNSLEVTANDAGFQYYDTDLGIQVTWDGSKWVNAIGVVAGTSISGTFANKPTIAANNIPVGFKYFCTDKQTTEGVTDGIEIIHKGNDVWVDALGRVVS